MAEIQPFGALRFTPRAGDLEALACPPYDIISGEERVAYLDRNSRNIIRLELPREGENPYGTAGETLKQWMEEGYLALDPSPRLYLYEEEFQVRGETLRIKGLVCRVRLEEFEKGVVLPHEETLSKAKTDRLNLMKATNCNFSSIYSLYFDPEGEIYPRLERLSAGKPEQAFSTADGIVHRVWTVEEEGEIAPIREAFRDRKLYIADGHHRYETALNYRNHLREQGPLDPDHPANYIMMTLVHMEHPGLVVFPTHRIVRGLPSFDPAALLEGCRAHFQVEECPPADCTGRLEDLAARGETAFALYCGGRAHLLVLRDPGVMDGILPSGSQAYRELDVNVLHLLILERLLHIDRENMANQKNLIYTRDPGEAMAQVDGGAADCAFLINATRVREIAAVAGAGEKMPQKSTYFYPKLITGHIMNYLGN